MGVEFFLSTNPDDGLLRTWCSRVLNRKETDITLGRGEPVDGEAPPVCRVEDIPHEDFPAYLEISDSRTDER